MSEFRLIRLTFGERLKEMNELIFSTETSRSDSRSIWNFINGAEFRTDQNISGIDSDSGSYYFRGRNRVRCGSWLLWRVD